MYALERLRCGAYGPCSREEPEGVGATEFGSEFLRQALRMERWSSVGVRVSRLASLRASRPLEG